jgi:hypothetical protein
MTLVRWPGSRQSLLGYGSPWSFTASGFLRTFPVTMSGDLGAEASQRAVMLSDLHMGCANHGTYQLGASPLIAPTFGLFTFRWPADMLALGISLT